MHILNFHMFTVYSSTKHAWHIYLSMLQHNDHLLFQEYLNLTCLNQVTKKNAVLN